MSPAETLAELEAIRSELLDGVNLIQVLGRAAEHGEEGEELRAPLEITADFLIELGERMAAVMRRLGWEQT